MINKHAGQYGKSLIAILRNEDIFFETNLNQISNWL